MIMMRMKQQGEGGGRRCEDCGNQAKKDCGFVRCRTCCRAKAFPCQTHLKSTWVPTYTKRHHKSKRPRDHIIISNSSPPVNLPAQVSSPATFKCVKVISDGSGDQYAYQTAVNIGGHVFKGILYDQGPEAGVSRAGAGESSSQKPNHHHIINVSAVNTTSTSADHQTLFPAPSSSSSNPSPFSPMHFFLHPKYPT